MDPDRRRASGIADGLIRMSVGLESPDEIVEDLLQALTERQ
jgi:cystathionine beta-lyase/cystathionine gamma-synthase